MVCFCATKKTWQMLIHKHLCLWASKHAFGLLVDLYITALLEEQKVVSYKQLPFRWKFECIKGRWLCVFVYSNIQHQLVLFCLQSQTQGYVQVNIPGLFSDKSIIKSSLKTFSYFSFISFPVYLFCLSTALTCFLLSALGITAGAHRLWSHRSYKASVPLRIFLAVSNSMAFQVCKK